MYARPWPSPYRAGSVGRPAFVSEFGLWDDQRVAAAEQIEAGLREVDFVRLVFCDLHGLARSKNLTTESFRAVLRNGMDFSPGPLIFDTGHAAFLDYRREDDCAGVDELVGAGDFVVVPDPLTFQMLEHTGPRTAWVLGDEYLRDGGPHPLAPRQVLRRVCAQYADRELAPVIGLEVEWYLTRRLDGPPGNVGNGFGQQGAPPVVEAMNSGYQFNLDTYYDSVAPVTDPLSRMLLSLGLPLRSMEHESGPGQIETTFDPLSALDAADAMLLFRTVTKQACARQKLHASFMSLPRLGGFDPSGWHLHQSVVNTRTGRNLFAAEGMPTDSADRLSPEGKAYVEGLLARARDLCLLSVPTINGYRRFGDEFTLAPTRIDWSFENRTVMVRALGTEGSTRFENRAGEPCANPYLAIAGQLFAGLDGLKDVRRPGPDEDAVLADRPAPTGSGTLPRTLAESVEAFRAGPAADLLGGPLASCLAKSKESELSRYEAWAESERPTGNEVTEWEQREYFESY